MTATTGYTLTPHERLLHTLVKRAATLNLKDLTFLAETAETLYAQRLEAEMRIAEFAVNTPPAPDPHGV